jgi:hypothetical protein
MAEARRFSYDIAMETKHRARKFCRNVDYLLNGELTIESASWPRRSAFGMKIGSWQRWASGCLLLSLWFATPFFTAAADAPASPPPGGWPEGVENSLKLAGTNRAQLVEALEKIPAAQRDGMKFLIENMPQPDLEKLTADFLVENVSLAYEALAQAPWAGRIPPAIFLNDILAYASVNEQRDNWRKRLREISQPLIKDCKTPTEAAMALNQKIFPLLKVKYSTQRRIPHQGPFETMETGVATCTGLSILLVDACRSVGVPARVVGTPLWFNKSGNHTWVEIWDGDWHYTGAAEQDPNGLDRGWFGHNASQAVKDPPEHGI